MVANQGNGDMTAPMSAACLPTMAIVEDGQEINQMYGYTMQMDTADMRGKHYADQNSASDQRSGARVRYGNCGRFL